MKNLFAVLTLVALSGLTVGCAPKTEPAAAPEKAPAHTESAEKPADAKPADAKPADEKPAEKPADKPEGGSAEKK